MSGRVAARLYALPGGRVNCTSWFSG